MSSTCAQCVPATYQCDEGGAGREQYRNPEATWEKHASEAEFTESSASTYNPSA